MSTRHPGTLAATLVSALAALLLTGTASAISLGNLDPFESGTDVLGWTQGITPTVAVQVDGGPTGTGDGYLEVTSDGTLGSSGKPATFNASQWAGDWLSAGVTGVSMNLQLFSSTDDTSLEIRLVLHQGTQRWTSTSAFSLPADGSWHQHLFDITEAGMTQVLGTATYDAVAAGVTRFMIRHDAGTPSFGGTAQAAVFGVDNIMAVPEPSVALLLMTLGVAGLTRLEKRS